jgi:hypothetical protein
MIVKLLKKSQPQEASERKPEATLAERIKETCRLAEEYINRHVDALKASEDAKALPRDWLKLDIQLKYGRCLCQCATALIDLEKKP